MSEKIFEKIEVSRIVLFLLAGVPWLTLGALVFNIGAYSKNIETRAFDSVEQKQQIIYKVNDPATTWNYEKLDARYVVKTELMITLDRIQEDQEKIMKKLNIE